MIRPTLAAAALVASANAFWGTGHLLIARQAETLLSNENPAALSWALESLNQLAVNDPSMTEGENKHPFTECATFADDIKGKGFWWQSAWHYIDLPYFSEGDTIADYPDYKMESRDVVQALFSLTNWINGVVGPDGDDSVYAYDVMIDYPNPADAQSFALRLIIHYIGDIHQPLHTTSEVNSQFPIGDRGGNDHKVPNICGASNLHAIWDSVIYDYCGYPKLPLTDSDWDWHTTEAAANYAEYPIDGEALNDNQWQMWADEGLAISKDFVYNGFVEGAVPSAEYQVKAEAQLKLRMNLGARRLADTIVNLYDNHTLVLLQ